MKMMHKLSQEGSRYFINYSKKFSSEHTFRDETIDAVFDFAYAMTFGDGEHRDHRTGGTLNRKKGQMFIHAFQGKLSELGVYNAFFEANRAVYRKLSEPDFEVYGLGEWDDSDISLDTMKFSVKSTKFYGNLLLLETKDWNEKGEYIPNLKVGKNAVYDYFVLVRIKPDAEKIMRNNRLLHSNNINKEMLYNLITSKKWEYDIVGQITNEMLKDLILHDFILPKKSLLNGTVSMDAENYYVQSGDMNCFKNLVSSLK